MYFELYPLRFRFRALDRLVFQRGNPANAVRGGLGLTIRHMECRPDCPGFEGARTGSCPYRAECRYARIFEPSSAGTRPSGFANPPRPFRLCATHLSEGTALPGTTFHIDLILFNVKEPCAELFREAFARLASSGMGNLHGRAEIAEVLQLDGQGGIERVLCSGLHRPLEPLAAPLRLSLDPSRAAVNHVVVRFVTPTELKGSGELVEIPEFRVLFARIRDRLSSLAEFHGSGALDIDYRALGVLAETVRTTASRLSRVGLKRRSSRTAQEHPIGGFVGEVEYAGDLTRFLPYLEAARWTGVGRQTVWGNGQIEVVSAAGPATLPGGRTKMELLG